MSTFTSDKKTYQSTVTSFATVDLYTFEYPWDFALNNMFVSKTKVTYLDDSNLKRLEAEHYNVFQLINGSTIELYTNPTGSNTIVSGDTTEEYDLVATPTNYYAHLQFPDDADIYNYFQLRITGTVNPEDSSRLRVRYSIYTPRMDGRIITETELKYGV